MSHLNKIKQFFLKLFGASKKQAAPSTKAAMKPAAKPVANPATKPSSKAKLSKPLAAPKVTQTKSTKPPIKSKKK